MINRNLWIFTPEHLQILHQNRHQLYSPQFLQYFHKLKQPFQDHRLTNYVVYHLIETVKHRRINLKIPFLQYKIIESSVQLYKRFYLLNTYQTDDAIQNLAVSIYLAMKLQQIDYEAMEKVAMKLKDKVDFGDICHFGYEQYTQKQVLFLKGINFQIDTMSLYCPLQSLLHMIKTNTQDKKIHIEIQAEIIRFSLRVFFTDLLFHYPAAKISLAIVIIILEKFQISTSCLKLQYLINTHSQQINSIKKILITLTDYQSSKDRMYMAYYQKYKEKNSQDIMKPIKKSNNQIQKSDMMEIEKKIKKI